MEICDKEKYEKIMANIDYVYSQDLLPVAFIEYLEHMSSDMNIKPKVIFDIGSCVQHFYTHAKRIWRDADIYCFDAFSYLKPLYKKTNVNFDNVLLYSDDYCKIKFYENPLYYGGNTIYREQTSYFPDTQYKIKETITLDTLVKSKKYPYPDLIKVDVQGAELDIIKGASQCLENASYLILELIKDNIDYNRGAYKKHEVIDYLKNIGWYVLNPAFSGNPVDDDWAFVNVRKLREKQQNLPNVY